MCVLFFFGCFFVVVFGCCVWGGGGGGLGDNYSVLKKVHLPRTKVEMYV